ncbi:MAG: RDD family protein, partial [Thermoleophilaceae bacterium]
APPGGWQQPVSQTQFQAAPGQLAGWGSRFGAAVLDGLIIFVPLIVIAIVIAILAAASGTAAVVVGILLGLAWIVGAFGYAPFLMAREGEHNGQTYGKQVVDIRAIRDNGQPWDFGSAALREIVLKGLAVGIASSIIPLIPFLLNYLWPLWDDSDRALHDMVVKSHVTRA